jgi:hypothetical protein
MSGLAARQVLPASIATVLVLGVLPALGQEVAKVEIGNRTLRVAGIDQTKSVRTDSSLQSINAPVFNVIAPDSPRTSSALAFPERRSAVAEMLQAHEFNLGSLGRHSRGLNDSSAVNGLGMDSVKLRISRNKVLLRVRFSFN